MALPVYTSKDVKVIWAGAPIDGLAPDSFVTFSRNSDLTDEEVGGDGQLSISRLPDKTGTCTISLQQGSRGNFILAAVMLQQENGQGFPRGSLTITDPSGSVLALLRNCHLKTPAEITLGSSATGQTRDWVFYCEELQFTSTPEGVDPTLVDAAIIAGHASTIMTNV